MKLNLDMESFEFVEDENIIGLEKDPERSGLEEMPDHLVVLRHRRKISAVIERIADLGLPQQEQQYRLVTRRAFNAIEVLEYVCKTERVVNLKMAVYSINYDAAMILLDLLNRDRIGCVEICMSNLRNGAHRTKEQILNEKLIGHAKIDIFYCSSHAKSMACETESGNYYCIEGSGNHAYNSRIEQYVFDNSKQVYEFNCAWMREIRTFLSGKKEYSEKVFAQHG